MIVAKYTLFLKKILNIFTSLDFGGVESHALMIAKSKNIVGFVHSFVAINTGGSSAEHLIVSGNEVFILNQQARIPSLKTIIYLIRSNWSGLLFSRTLRGNVN